MSDLNSVIREQTATEQIAAIKAGELDARELFEAYRSRAAADTYNAFTWVADEAPAELPAADTPLAGLPVAVKDLFSTEGVPTQAGSKLLEGYRPPYTSTAVAKLEAAGATMHGKTNQDEFAMGSSNENSASAPARTRGIPSASRWILRWQRRRRRRRPCAVGARHRHRRVDPPARRDVRARRTQAHLRRRQPLRDDRVRIIARSGWPHHALGR